MKRLLRFLILGITLVAPQLRADLSSDLRSANESLASGHPIDALTRYQTLTTDPSLRSEGSPELWYDLGLAEEKTGDLPKASLSFRRALLLDPTFTPARRKLETVLGALGVPMPSDRQEALAATIHPEILILVGSVIGWIAVFALILLIFLAPRRKGMIALAVVMLIAGHGGAVLGGLVDPRRIAANRAVVTAKKAPLLRATPVDTAESGGTLLSGSSVSVLSRNGAWWYVSGGPSLTGWIPSDSVTPLLPFASGKGS